MTLPTVAVEIGRLEGWTLGTSLLGTDTFLATYAYEEITPWVRSFTIRRGRQHELNRVETGTASVMAINQEGTFNATNTASPFYPDIRPMVPLRIRATTAEIPETIAGLTAWYDFSDISTLWQNTTLTTPITADGQTILGVTDKSGNSRHLDEETTTGPQYKTAIINGLSVARFDGTNDRLYASDYTADTSFTVLIIVQKRSAPSGSSRTVWSADTNAQLYTNSGSSPTAYRYFGTDTAVGGTATNVSLMILRVNSAASLDVFANGGSPTNLDPSDQVTTSTIYVLGAAVGGTNFGDYDVGEVIYYDSALGATDLNLLGEYLADKWGITWTNV